MSFSMMYNICWYDLCWLYQKILLKVDMILRIIVKFQTFPDLCTRLSFRTFSQCIFLLKIYFHILQLGVLMTKNKFVTLYYPKLIRNAKNNVHIPFGGVYEPNYDNLKKNHDNLKKNPDNSKKKSLNFHFLWCLFCVDAKNCSYFQHVIIP